MHDKWTGPELDSLIGRSALTRREMLVTSLAVGFAAAALPVRADTVITTTSDGLTAGEVKIPVPDGEIPAYRAMPAAGGPFPVVLVVQEIFGVHEHIKDVCRRFAREGYCAVAPELYARQGDVSKFTDYREIFAQVVSKVPDAQVMADLDAAVAWAAKSSKGDDARVGVTGFCWGGRITWLYAAHNPKLKAGVAWYGRLVGEADRVAAEVPDRRRGVAARTGARALRRTGPGHPARGRREDARRARGGEAVFRDRRVPRRAARVPCRLPAEFPGAGCAGGLGPVPRVVPQAGGRAGRRLIAPEYAHGRHQRQPVAVLAVEDQAAVRVVPVGEIHAAGILPVECVRDLGKHREVAARQLEVAADAQVHGREVGEPI